MKPDFENMNIAELQAYLLLHQDDDGTFYKFADRLEASSENSDLYPLPETPENIAIMEAAIAEQVKNLEEKRTG
ncbi:hypothetical protein HCG51_20330 [Tolypothrix sp. PCC 7910]|uniref:DUF6887 family protein n=1 Tax=Tolypothrix sp. PCC 7910 TaxID=2099387 RepID=UPI00142772A2|nr:hypothetical protein [Tolypothrix sp. PCC 7910]QIR38816.1 hypothetical protein HCG51_20330 [Tolypothrix sp. PCC 7910]